MSMKVTYQGPELVEVGAAQKVTLGAMGASMDGCGCCLEPEASLA